MWKKRPNHPTNLSVPSHSVNTHLNPSRIGKLNTGLLSLVALRFTATSPCRFIFFFFSATLELSYSDFFRIQLSCCFRAQTNSSCQDIPTDIVLLNAFCITFHSDNHCIICLTNNHLMSLKETKTASW